MSNLTIAVDDHLIKQARVRAIQQGTSLSAKVRDFLQAYVNEPDKTLAKQRADATVSLMAAIELATAQTSSNLKPASSAASANGQKRRTLREELYDGDFRARDRLQTPGARSKTRASQ
jgi:plasmid stability protein